MGAHDFSAVYYGPLSLRDAYDKLCDDARHEYGSSGYNGTISTTSGAYLHDPNLAPMTEDEAYRRVGDALDNYSKWEACGAFPLVAKEHCKPDTTVTVTVRVPGPIIGTYDGPERAALAAAVAAKVKLAPGQYIKEFDYNPGTGWVSEQLRALPAPKVRTKVEATATDGKAETRYFLIREGGRPVDFARDWAHGHPSQAAARAAAVQVLKNATDLASTNIRIEAHTLRASGEPVVTVTRTVVSTEVTVLVTLAHRAPHGTPRAGWLYFGWAAS